MGRDADVKKSRTVCVCAACGRETLRYPSRQVKYCSPACYHKPRGTIRRFWENVRQTASCWLWEGGTKPDGYGRLWSEDQCEEGAHCFAYRLYYGTIPAGFMVCHSCDEPLCVNPAHLFLGTQLDNMRDMIRKGRKTSPVWIGVYRRVGGWSKLDPIAVQSIREEYAAGGVTQRSLARRYNVTVTSVRRVIKHRTWRQTVA